MGVWGLDYALGSEPCTYVEQKSTSIEELNCDFLIWRFFRLLQCFFWLFDYCFFRFNSLKLFFFHFCLSFPVHFFGRICGIYLFLPSNEWMHFLSTYHKNTIPIHEHSGVPIHEHAKFFLNIYFFKKNEFPYAIFFIFPLLNIPNIILNTKKEKISLIWFLKIQEPSFLFLLTFKFAFALQCLMKNYFIRWQIKHIITHRSVHCTKL